MKTDDSSNPPPLHVGRPNIGDRQSFMSRINTILDNAWLTNQGPFLKEFEQRLADYLGAKHCIAVANGTIALELAIRALDLSDEVILPSLTFVATAHALQWQRIQPVFCDIGPNTYNIDPGEIERHITSRTSAILGVHLYGRPCEVKALENIAHRHNLKLIFDAAHAFGCSYQGRMIGNFGDCEVFSFSATKFFNTFEGGAIITNHDDLAHKIRLMQNFGFQGLDTVISIGINGKMNEISAAMGLTNLESLNTFLAHNEGNYYHYLRGFKGIEGLTMLEYDSVERHNWQYIVVEVDTAYPLSRDELMRRLHTHNVLARRYFWPGCHRMEPYRSYYPKAGVFLPRTTKKARHVLVFPTGVAISEAEIDRIIELCRVNTLSVQEIVEIKEMSQKAYDVGCHV